MGSYLRAAKVNMGPSKDYMNLVRLPQGKIPQGKIPPKSDLLEGVKLKNQPKTNLLEGVKQKIQKNSSPPKKVNKQKKLLPLNSDLMQKKLPRGLILSKVDGPVEQNHNSVNPNPSGRN